MAYTALHDVLPIEQAEVHREEFAALAFLAELIGDEICPTRGTQPKADAPATPTRALSVLEIGHHLREASERYDAVRDDASKWLLDELLGWRRLALTRQPVTLCDAAAQLAVLFDHLGELDTHLLEGRPETLDLRNDLQTTERVVAGLAATVARIAGLDLATVSEDSLPSRLASTCLR